MNAAKRIEQHKSSTYRPRPIVSVTTQDLIATIARDANDVATFEARHAFATRTGTDWRRYAPAAPRTVVSTSTGGGRILWLNFHETGML